MRIGVLGPVVVDPEPDPGLGGPRQRRLLAALVANAGNVVSTDLLGEIVFEGDPTPAAATTLRSYVARLRRALDGCGSTITTRSPGYAFHPGTASLDADLFADAVAEAHAHRSEGRPAEALESVNRGLELWRGPAYAEFAAESWIQPEAIRLEELRVQAEELRLGCLIAIGRHAEALSDLSSFVERQPLREEPRMLLLTAMYRSGRQADALRAADAYRAELAEIGLEPTGDFDRLEESIVVQDPELRRPPPAGRALRGYRLETQLSTGDDYVVNVALQPGVERLVAITSFAASIADHPLFIREFESQVQKVARIEHPNLVEILDFWREPGSAHLVTRLVRGGDFTELLEKGPLAADTVARVIAQLGAALAEVHAHGLWHGHVAAEDVLLETDGTLRLAGVGTTEIVDIIRQEGADDVFEPGPARDQLALATLAHQALTGLAPPIRRMGDLPRVSDARPELLALDGVIARAGAPHHGDRYPDIASFARSFADAIGTGAPDAARSTGANPYKGLRAFDETDSADFFGREDLTAELLDLMAEQRLVAVVGPSGSGKSSVVRAGVVPRVTARHHPQSRLVTTMVPGSAPFDELTAAVRRVVPLARSGGLDAATAGVHETLRLAAEDDPLLLVIDQLEELYTLVLDATERARFIDGLMDALDDDEMDLRVLITLRADFFDRPLQHHRLGAALSDGAVAIPAMSPAQLERAVVEPAATAGVTFETPVVAELVADVVDQPAGLPLLQFSLTELFEARSDGRITIEDHARLGGVAGAIAARAERLYDDAPAAEQELIRLLFLRLVSVGGDAVDLRRRTDRWEIASASPDPQAMDRVIDRFGAARLLTFDRNPATRAPTVEVAHEALLRHWPRLRTWIDDAGRDLLIRAHLTTAAAGWEVSERDPGELYRGGRLTGMENWLERVDLTESERAFLGDSLQRRADEEAAERAQLEQQIRANARLRRVLAALGAVLVIALIAGFVAVTQRNRAREETARAEEARGRSLAVSAGEQLANDRSLALLLAVEASALDPSDTSRRSLLEALGGDDEPGTRTVIPTPAAEYVAIAFTPDGTVAAAKRAAGAVDIVDLRDRQVMVADLPGPSAPAAGIDVSSDGELLVTSGQETDGVAAIVYRVADGSELTRIPSRVAGGIHQAIFVPATREILLGDAEGVLTTHDAETGEQLAAIDTGTGSEITGLAVAGQTAYVIDAAIEKNLASSLSAWDLETGERLAGPVTIQDEFLVRVAVSEQMVVAAGGAAHVFDPETLAPIADFGEALGGSTFVGLAISPEGLVAVGSTIDLEVWAGIGEDDGPFQLPISGQAPGVGFTPDGSTLVTADPDGTVSTWRLGWIEDLGEPLVPEGPGLVTVSPDGEVVAVWARGRGVQLFDRETLGHLGELEGLGPEDSFLGLDFSPDGNTIVTSTCPVEQMEVCDSVISLYDVDSRERISGPVDSGSVVFFLSNAVEFAGDGTQVVAAGASGDVILFEVPTLQEAPVRLGLADVAAAAGLETIGVTAGEKDGRSFVAALGDFGQTAVWDISGEPTPVGPVETPSNGIWFAPDGELYVGSVNGPIHIWDPITLEQSGPPIPSKEPAGSFGQSETGVLAVNSLLGGTTLWDVATRQPLSGDLPAFVSDIDPDGSRVLLGAIGADQGGVRVASLPLDIDSLSATACEHAGRNLTAEEWQLYMPEDEAHRATCGDWPIPLD